MKETEQAIERYLCRKVSAIGGMCLKFASATDCGFPDRLILIEGGRAAWCELKAPGKKPRPIQVARIERLRSLGFEAEVCDSRASVDDYIEKLTNHGI